MKERLVNNMDKKKSNISKEEKHIGYIDIAIGISIILIIIGHIVEPGLKRNLIYSFHMPLLIIISGILYKDKNLKICLQDVIKKLIIPYLIAVFFADFVREVLINNNTLLELLKKYAEQIMLSYSFLNVKTNIQSISVLWLFPLLAIISVLFCTMKRMIKKDNDIFLGLFCIILSYLGYIIGLKQYWLPFSLDVVFACIIFYYFGYILNKYNVLSRLLNDKKTLLLIFFIWILGIKYGNIEIAIRKYTNGMFCFLSALCGSLIVMKLSMIIEKKYKKIGEILGWYGKNGIYVLILHYLEMQLINYSWLKGLCIYNTSYKITVLIIKLLIITFGVVLINFTKGEERKYIIDKLKRIFCKLNLIEKVFITMTVIMIFLAIINKLVVQLSDITFIVFGIWAIMFLILLIFEVSKIAKVNLKDKQFIFLNSVTIIAIFSIYAYVVLTRKMIYTWDNSCYYLRQLYLLEKFDANFITGIKEIIKTTYYNDYGYFLLSFTSLIFKYTNQTENSFILTYTFVSIIPIVLLYSMIIKKVIAKLNLTDNRKVFILSLVTIISFPLLHRAAIMGQPDIMGLLFVELIILLTIDYDFSKIENARVILIVISTLCLLITRRWYVYWIVSYYFTYFIIVCINQLIKKDYSKFKVTLINMLKVGVCSIIIIGAILSPMIYKLIDNNFNSSYSAWNIGGLAKELELQYNRVGGIFIGLIIVGLIYGLINKKCRNGTLQMIFTASITIFMFTRLQNMGNHHSLLLIPTYVYMLIMCIVLIDRIKVKAIRNGLFFTILLISIVNLYGSLSENKRFHNNLYFCDTSLKPIKREDYDRIGEMAKFILDNCNNGEKAYINAATLNYCAQTFSNYIHPDRRLNEIIPYESSINSAHGFPTGIFESKYVFISNTVLENTGAKKGTIIPKIKYAFEESQFIKERFELIETFKMTDKIKFYAYQRKKQFDDEEAKYFMNLFKEETEQYPELFGNRIQKYLINKNKVK